MTHSMTLAITIFLSLPHVASAKCLGTPDGVCRYPKGDAWCVANHKPPYAYTDKCQQADAAPSRVARVDADQTAADPTQGRESQTLDLKKDESQARQTSPSGMEQAAAQYNARDGSGLASAPKVRPDGGMYYMHGKLQQATDNRPVFIASLSSSQADELASAFANMLGRHPFSGITESHSYFKVIIPEAMQATYFEKAKINGGFDLVGRYVSNVSYATVAGQEMAAPVFEAVYFVMWEEPVNLPRTKPGQVSRSSTDQYAKEVERYIPVIRDKVQQFWVRPPEITGDLETVVSVRLSQGGDVVPNSVSVENSSGNTAFDRSVIAAVYNASPIPVPSGPPFERFREFTLRFSP